MLTRLAPWGNTTDPWQHDDSRFRYLVHMDSGLVHGSFGYERSRTAAEPPIEGAHFFDDLSEVNKVDRLSASLIDQDHRSTWSGRLGLILGVPNSDIIYNSPYDSYSGHVERHESNLEALSVMDPDSLLKQTGSRNAYNEVVCTPGNISIEGLLYLVGNWGYRPESPAYDEALQKASKLGLPLVELSPATSS